MKIGVAGCVHESNTFAPSKTTLKDFEENWVVGAKQFINRYKGTNTEMGGVIEASEVDNWELIPIFFTQAIPKGTVTREAMDTILSNLLGELKKVADSLDGLVLILHGAMVSENIKDVEGEVIRKARSFMKDKPIAVTLDLHANITEEMVEESEIIVGYNTYPHIDMKERAIEACKLICSTIKNQIKPITVIEKPNLLVSPSSMDTNVSPMKDIMDKAFEYEKDPEVLNVTIAGGFPYSDVKFAGFSIVVITNDNQAKAEKIAKELSGMVIAKQNQFKTKMKSVEESLSIVNQKQKKPIIFIESSDNVGGGSPADATHVLQKLIDHGQDSFLTIIYDPENVEKAINIGLGGNFEGRVGGKVDKNNNSPVLHGEPVLIKGKVRLLSNGEFVHHGPHKTGLKSSMGKTAVISLDDCENSVVVLTEKRVSPRDINQYRSLGLEVEQFKIIVVKAAIAWKTAFETVNIEDAIEIDTPGCCSSNLNHFSYINIPKDTTIIT